MSGHPIDDDYDYVLPVRSAEELRHVVDERVVRARRRRRVRRAGVPATLAAVVVAALLLARAPEGETSLHTPAAGGSAEDVAEVPAGASPGSGETPTGSSATPTPALAPPSPLHAPDPLAQPAPPRDTTAASRSDEYRLAVTRAYQLWELGRDGQPLRKLASDVTESEWAPDGRRLAYRRSGSTTVGWWYEIRILDTESMQDRLIVSSESSMSGLSFSADGTLLAFSRSASSATTPPRLESTVAVVDLDSPNMSDQWEFGPAGNPSWLPDGRILHRYEGELWIATARGSNRVVVPNSKEAIYPSASPDGSWITFLGAANGAQVMRIDGTDRRTVSGSTGGYPPEWSPDSSRVFYRTDSGIRSVRRDGTDVRVVTEYTGESWFAVGRR